VLQRGVWPQLKEDLNTEATELCRVLFSVLSVRSVVNLFLRAPRRSSEFSATGHRNHWTKLVSSKNFTFCSSVVARGE
jgi:hypothetical protein